MGTVWERFCGRLTNSTILLAQRWELVKSPVVKHSQHLAVTFINPQVTQPGFLKDCRAENHHAHEMIETADLQSYSPTPKLSYWLPATQKVTPAHCSCGAELTVSFEGCSLLTSPCFLRQLGLWTYAFQLGLFVLTVPLNLHEPRFSSCPLA